MTAPASTLAGTWTTGTTARAGFAARHLGFTTVHGTIAITSGTLEIDADGHPTRLAGTLDPATVDTANPRRDRDLRAGRFLDVEHHPAMELTATEFTPSPDGWRTSALLRVKGHDAPLWIDGTIAAAGDGRLRVKAQGRLYLPDAGLRPPRFLVGHTVQVTIDTVLTVSGGTPPGPASP